jgi:S1-C subfamily serine protease
VNTLDLLLIMAALAAAVGGHRLGFLTRVTSWAGMALGLVVAARSLPWLIRTLEGGEPSRLLFVAIGTLIGGAFLGQALGLVVGSRLHLSIPPGPGRRFDRAAGAAVGLLGVVIAFWLLLPTMADVRGWFAEQARSSMIAALVDERLPVPPDTLGALRGVIGDAQFPRVFDALQRAPELGPPPADSGLSPEVQARVRPSTVKIRGIACRRVQEGSGFVVAPDLVVTNAHVVAGEPESMVEREDGSAVRATVVAFDPRRDLAILAAPGLGREPLPLADIDVGGRGAVFGHPGGGPMRVAAFEVGRRVSATGTDIYDREPSERDVLVLAAGLAPGDSGAGLIDPEGRVVGVAFAIAPDRPGVAYALSTAELEAVLAEDLATPTDTGPCLR